MPGREGLGCWTWHWGQRGARGLAGAQPRTVSLDRACPSRRCSRRTSCLRPSWRLTVGSGVEGYGEGEDWNNRSNSQEGSQRITESKEGSVREVTKESEGRFRQQQISPGNRRVT